MDKMILHEDAGFGVDVAVQRADDLDKKMLTYLENKAGVKVLELGCGAGGQSVRMAMLGVEVLSIDIIDYNQKFNDLRDKYSLSKKTLEFKQGDIRNVVKLLDGKKFDIACLQRVVHYLTYQEAMVLLRELRLLISEKLFISVSGLNTDIGINYQDREKDISERYCCLDNERAKLFNIKQPLCLYSKDEFHLLLEKSGWKVEEIWVSAFGNIKAVCG